MTSHATSPQNQSALPDTWVERIFDHMAALYGSKFADLWRNTDAEKVKSMWAFRLGGFADKPQAIKSALDALDDRPFPPTLPEFIALCRQAASRMGSDTKALPYKPTAEDIERQREMANVASAAVSVAKVKDGIDQHWATHPRSHAHLRAIFSAANSDRRFLPCVQKMVDDGICSADGQAIRFYRGSGEWISA